MTDKLTTQSSRAELQLDVWMRYVCGCACMRDAYACLCLHAHPQTYTASRHLPPPQRLTHMHVYMRDAYACVLMCGVEGGGECVQVHDCPVGVS